jgi:PelA/Pel-15E family pectate lyase
MNFIHLSCFGAFIAFSLSLLCVPAKGASPDPHLPEQVRQALIKVTHTLRTEAAYFGGYLGAYSPDFSEGFGKMGVPAERHWNWLQDPGTTSMGLAYLKAWRATRDPLLLEAAADVASALLRGQLESGGWYDYIDQSQYGDKWIRYRRVDGGIQSLPKESPPPTPRWVRYNEASSTTLDDNITQGAIRFLMQLDEVLEALGKRNESVFEAILYALDSLVEAQNDLGGWPQNFPTMEGARASYDDYSTYNDHVHYDTMDVLMAGYRAYGDSRYYDAVVRGGDFVLKTQLPEPTPIWAPQYDADLQPGQARRAEPATEIYPPESGAIVQLLLELALFTGDLRYLDALASAVAWFERTQDDDGKWFRRYEMITGKPLTSLDSNRFPHAVSWARWWYADAHPADDITPQTSRAYGDRVLESGVMARRIRELGVAEYEHRRQPYQWTENRLSGGGPRLRILAEEERLTPSEHLQKALSLEPAVRRILDDQDERGLWIGTWFRLPGRSVVSMNTIQSHMGILSDYLIHLSQAAASEETSAPGSNAEAPQRDEYIYSSNFNRHASGATTDGALIGPGWHILSGTWRIYDNELRNTVYDPLEAMILQTRRRTRSDDGYAFNLSASFYVHGREDMEDRRRVGLVWHAQNADNYYRAWFHFRSLEEKRGRIRVDKVVDGEVNILFQTSSDLPFQQEYLTFHLSTEHTRPHTFNLMVSNDAGETLLSTAIIDSQFVDGYAGFWKNASARTSFDDLSLEVIPPW